MAWLLAMQPRHFPVPLPPLEPLYGYMYGSWDSPYWCVYDGIVESCIVARNLPIYSHQLRGGNDGRLSLPPV